MSNQNKEKAEPKQGDIIYEGVPGVHLESVEFIAVTSRGDFLVWNSGKTRANVSSRKFCYKDAAGLVSF